MVVHKYCGQILPLICGLPFELHDISWSVVLELIYLKIMEYSTNHVLTCIVLFCFCVTWMFGDWDVNESYSFGNAFVSEPLWDDPYYVKDS